MRQIILFLSLSILSLTIRALPVATVTHVKGKVMFEDKALIKGDVMARSGVLSTGPRSFVRVTIKEWENAITLGPNSKMQLDLRKKTTKKKYQFLSGSCRWKTLKKGKKKGVIYTRRVAMGVRGTDYLLKHDDMLNESEVVVFEGAVSMKNVANEKEMIVREGQWGGLGGRFGESLKGPIDLPKKFVEKFDRTLKFKR
ncbi:MAG: FecR domain-containing protein [Oligoflexia bacterium]|nr:FecR domain-containing protein [Oligoflexia bacterium]